MAERYRLVVVGGGAGGLVVAAGAALFGAKVALVEKCAVLGGDCLNEGCVPSKAFIRAANAAHALRTADRFGLPAQPVEADLGAVMDYVDRAVRTVAVHDSVERFERLGVDVLTRAPARFLGPGRLRAGERVLEARHIVVATGTRPADPAIPGLDASNCFDTSTLWHGLRTLPRRLVVIGGGPIGCELGQAFARLGAAVTIVQRGPQLLPREEPEAAAVVTEALRAEGIDVRLATTPIAARHGLLELEEPGGLHSAVPFDVVLVAAGRQPNIDGLDLDAAGVRLDERGFIAVDAAMRTSAPGVLAVGDVAGGLLFTHVAEAEAKIALRNALFPFTARMSYRVVPWATFTDPEVGRVGADEASLKAAGLSYAAHVFPFADVDRAVTDGATRGFVKVLATPKGKVLGATIVGAHAGELIHEFAMAMRRGIPLSGVSGLIHAYPTWSLANRRAADGFMRGKLDGPTGRLLRWLAQR